MFAVKVGDEVGTVWSSSHSYLSANICKVTKINGHGHIYLDNGDVYDKHGSKRTAGKSYSGMRLVEAKYVYAEKAANVERQRKNSIVSAVEQKFAGMKNGYGHMCEVTDADKAELIALINSL